MRKLIVLVGIAVIATVAVVWSMSTLATPKIGDKVGVSEASAPLAPHDIMVRHGKGLPVEHWTDPF